MKTRVLLMDLFGGKIRLKQKVPELWAHWNLAPAVLLRAEGTNGSGGALSPVPSFAQSAWLK